MKGSFLEYYKTILEKVSFDKELFVKEYHKAMKMVEATEAEQLSKWIQARGFKADLMTVENPRRNFPS